ncbi:MAG: toxin-antitoxin system HicB family antitoxin [Bacteroidales bacterium]|nr:toxin-antitoxin system HicB family antitoxin [Bacteroidales bacterium]
MERVQVIVRLKPELMARVKRAARRENRSMNSFVERTLEKATGLEFPKLPKDFKVSDEILSLGGTIAVPTQEMLDKDAKLAYLWGKYGGE